MKYTISIYLKTQDTFYLWSSYIIDYSKQNIQFAQSLTDAKAIVYADKGYGSKASIETRSGENKSLFKITTADDIKELNIYGKGYKWDVHSFLQISQREFFMGIRSSESLPQTRFLHDSNPRTIYTDVTNPASPIMYEFPYELYKTRDFYFLDNDYVLIGACNYHLDGRYIAGYGNLLCYSVKEDKIYKSDKKFGTIIFKDNKVMAASDWNLLIMEFDKSSKQFSVKCLSSYSCAF
ncbi:MAG TPA: hypothetical protein PLM73_06215 [Petrotogaceae bacterium]|nr:hypothetical protein [Petrotogaceae bacterium]